MKEDNIAGFTSDYAAPNFLRKNFAGLFDAALILLLFVGATYYLPQSILDRLQHPVRIEIYILLLLAFYRLFSIFLLNGTIGMKLCKIKMLSGEMTSLSAKEKFFAAFFILINGVDYYNVRS